MLYLIGVTHEVQSISVGSEETADHTRYRQCLERTIQEYDPAFVAEEYSDDALSMSAGRRNEPQEFFTKKVATSRNVEHLLCDAPLKVKYSMGYQGWDGWEIQISRIGEPLSECDDLLPRALEIVKDFPLREDYWLNQLRHILQMEVVFVCGNVHLETFGSRLESNGIPYQIVGQRIGMPAGLIDEFESECEKVKAYIERRSQYIEDVFQKILFLNSGEIPAPYDFNWDDFPGYA
jgi:hypothetical protein